MKEYGVIYATQLWNALRLQLAFAVFFPFFKKRKNFLFRIVSVVMGELLLLAMLSYLIYSNQGNVFVYFLTYTLMSLCSMLLVAFCFRGKLFSYIFHFFSASMLATCVAAIRECFLIVGKMNPEWKILIHADGIMDLVVTSIIMLIIYYVLYRVYSLKFSKYRDVMLKRDILGVYAADTIVLTIIHAIANDMENNGVYGSATLLFLTSILFVTSTLYMQYAILMGKYYELQKEKEETEKNAIQRVSRETFELYSSLKENMDIINIKCHDIKYRLSNNYQGMDDVWTKELIDSIDIYDRTIKTGNEELDTVLTHHQLFFDQHDIRFACVADGSKLSFMELADIYILFGNACSNVEEYLCNVDKEKRFARMWIKTKQEFLLIHVENYYEGELRLKDGFPITSKMDESDHGFGIKSMKMIAEKYEGELDISVEGNLFLLNICIPIPA